MPDDRFIHLRARGIELTLDRAVGHIRTLRIEHDGRVLEPLHTAPWINEPKVTEDESIDPGLRWLSGDFFCAPFAASDRDGGPGHGWPANTPWRHRETVREGDRVTGVFELERTVMGARVSKTLTLRDGHPFVYERHVFEGGKGRLPVANHLMTRFGQNGGRLAFSPKRHGETPPVALETDPERGRALLHYPSHFTDLRAVPLASGGVVDLTRYPLADDHEDFAMLIEAEGAEVGWATALRHDARDVVLSLKAVAELPVTMLWFSNGGRRYAPWNGRHIGVLGIEEGRSYGGMGHEASIADNPLSQSGVPTALDLHPAGQVTVRNVIGAIGALTGWDEAPEIGVEDGQLRIGTEGHEVRVPFDTAFLRG